jgi:uncharacterized protein
MSATVRKMNAPHREDPRDFLQLGIVCSTGARGAPDMIAAHKWFNLAAMHGNGEAALLRREIAAEMSAGEIAAAQRAARDWVTLH